MNRGVIWLLVVAVIVVGLLLFFRNNDADELDNRAEDIKEDTRDMGEDLEDTGRRLFTDGTFAGQSDTDDHGNYGSIDLVVKDGKITEASYIEYQEANNQNPKDENYPYQLALQAMEKLEADLIDEQDPDDVDTVAGATGTSDKFRVAAKRALEKAK